MRIVQWAVDTGELTARLGAEPQATAIMLDVDGTLAPIVPRPEDAVVPDETRALLERLVERYALVAFVSGRTSDDAAALVAVEGAVYVGEHGLELDPRAGEWAPRIAEFADSAGWPAERNRLSVAFHWRTAENQQAALTELRAVAERALAAGLRPRWGRKVLEVRPPVDADKGTAIRRVLDEHGLRRALYAGDDTTDLDAFRGLDGLELAVRVAIVSEEGPNELGEGADIVLGGPEALVDLLRKLL